jgi:selenide,water dikinase
MRQARPVTTDIVLLGGGHAHVHVLAAFARRPLPGVRVTLVSRDLETPYSGMLPGVVAGLYTAEEAHIDLLRLATATATRLIHAEAIGLDRREKRVLLRSRPPLAYDLLSIDVGITPALDSIEGAAELAIAVKPIGSFLDKLAALLQRCRAPDGPRRIAMIGGGAGGVELLLSLRSRLLAALPAARFHFALLTAGSLLESHGPRVQAAFRRVLRERDIALHEKSRVSRIDAQGIVLESGPQLAADAVLVATDAAPPPWFPSTGLALDKGGFLAVGPTLQSLNDPDVLAAGDCAGLLAAPREKAGVYAVRAGPPLARNLRRRALGLAPQPWRPQQRHLALISTGERYAVASRGGLKAEGGRLWRLKDWIDRRWMRMYQEVEPMLTRMAQRPPPPPAAGEREAMRCGGCAAKVGPAPLGKALARLPPLRSPAVLIGLELPDDAAVIRPSPGAALVQTVDFFRAFIDDPYVFGEVAANHALNDVFAMGGVPRHALATAVLPAGPAAKVEEMLFQVLAGARACLDREQVALVGGHSSEGQELAFGLSVTGEVAPDAVARKGGLGPGDVLVLTRPLRTGILFAAAMRARAKASWVEAALAEMRRSNRDAAAILLRHGATALTDVSGFGLGGHLREMLVQSGATAELDLARLPLYPGVAILAQSGIASTLLPENLALEDLLAGTADAATKAILFDPQTAGGLLAGLPAPRADACLAELHRAGFGAATAIGRVSGTPRTRAVQVALTGALP